MNKPVIETDKRAKEPLIVEIIESVDSPTQPRSRLALIPAGRISTQSIHLKSDEYTIVSQKESGA